MQYPFLTPAYLNALEDSASVGSHSGWQPCHLQLDHGDQLQAFMPLYLKTHSWGEYVFDWAWADAYRRHGLAYYPKLVTAIPFTPTTGPRVRLTATTDPRAACRQLLDQVIELAGRQGASSWHLLFPDTQHLQLFTDERLLKRTGVQFHWYNQNYQTFDDFLENLIARKRKMIRRERRRVADQGISLEVRHGADIDGDLWDFFFHLYRRTYQKRSGSYGYLTRDFFRIVGRALANQIVMAVARKAGKPVACALYFRDSKTLYGRYWGSLAEFDCLHFELCYYQGIDYAIGHGLYKFDAGAQGEHKIPRGFLPIATHSLHWIKHPQFAEAIARFLAMEQLQIQDYMEETRCLLPYRDPDFLSATT